MKAHLRHARLSPKKMNLVAGMIRKMPVTDALSTLKKFPKKGAEMLYGVVASAVANAENNDGQSRNSLFIKELVVNKGQAFRRFIPMARGRARGIDKWTSHVTVKLGIILPEGEEDAPSVVSAQDDTTKKKAAEKEMEKKKKERESKIETVSAKPVEISDKPGAARPDEDTHAQGSDGSQDHGPTFQVQRKGSRGT
jgi:large subunit ribosomal protein L22